MEYRYNNDYNKTDTNDYMFMKTITKYLFISSSGYKKIRKVNDSRESIKSIQILGEKYVATECQY